MRRLVCFVRQNKGICMRRASGAGFLAAVWGLLRLSGLLAALLRLSWGLLRLSWASGGLLRLSWGLLRLSGQPASQPASQPAGQPASQPASGGQAILNFLNLFISSNSL